MLFEPFLLRALAAGLAIAAVAGPMGCFIVWRRLAYFGDTMAHSALLGVAAGFMLAIEPMLAVTLVTVTIAVALVILKRARPWLSSDALLGILSHAALSFGLVALGMMASLRIDLLAYLFGDILSVTATELWVMMVSIAAILAVLAALWRPLLAATVHEDLARAEGVPVLGATMGFTVLIALVIALAMKMVGALLITALLIIPAATARRFSRQPETMAIVAAILGMMAVTGGLAGSLALDTPTGPSIVVAAALLFALSQLPLRWSARRSSAGPKEPPFAQGGN